MRAADETAALVALLRHRQRLPRAHGRAPLKSELLSHGARALLELDLGLLADHSEEAARAAIAAWHDRGYRPSAILTTPYLANLAAADDPPALLFIHGRVTEVDRTAVALIGSRNATEHGCRDAERFAGHLAQHGITVVSGLASGIDTAAHLGALKHQGRTIAVIGTGLEHSYPPENSELQQRIAGHGAVLSQFWPETPPSPANFRARNATIAGLSAVTVVIEAGPMSGARIAVRHALALERPVLVLPRLLDNGWVRDLAQRGQVRPIREPEEVISALR